MSAHEIRMVMEAGSNHTEHCDKSPTHAEV